MVFKDDKKIYLGFMILLFIVINISSVNAFFPRNTPPPSPINPSLDYNWTGHNIFHNITVFNYTGIDLVNMSYYWGPYYYTSANIANWDTAYAWGNHASAGYVPYIGANTNVNLGNFNLTTTRDITADYVYSKNQVAQFHSTINQSIPTNDIWQNITWNMKIDIESPGNWYNINTSNNNESITVNGFDGILRVQGCIHPYNNDIGNQDATIWLRVLVNGDEKRCLQSSKSKGFRGNGIDILQFIGTITAEHGDEIVVQWRVDNTNIEIRGDPVFDNPVSASINFEKISDLE
jgi:hypothetical protein